MPEITVSDAQAEFLESLRTEMQAETRYGYVRKRDALQYLIDNVDTDDIDVEVDVDVAPPSETDDGVGDESTEEQAAEAVEHQDDEAAADGGAAADGSTQGEGADGGTTSTSSSPMPDPSDDSEEGDDRLNAMMNLLDTHDDKWREASKEDARYEVDMPDGTTEYVQTKDDVRAHLFKNY